MAIATDPRSEQATALAEELRVIFSKLRRRVTEQAGAGELTASQVSVLKRLEAGGAATTSALARAEAMRPQSMATIVAALQAAGLIAGEPDPRDGRQTLLSLTDACRARLKHDRAARLDWLSRSIVTRLTAREQDDLARAAQLLKRLADD